MTPFEPRVRLLALVLALGSCQSAFPGDASPDGSAEPGAGALALTDLAAARTGKLIYGPQSFGPGLHFRFFRVAGPTGPCTLSVANGNIQTGQSRVAGALVVLNGQTVVGLRDLTTKVASVERSVTPHKVNLLSVLVIGKQDSFITLSIAPQTLDTPPVANAGADQTIPYPYLGQSVVLDGSASSDIDGDLLTYRWDLVSRPAGSVAALEDPTGRCDLEIARGAADRRSVAPALWHHRPEWRVAPASRGHQQ